MSTLSLSIGCAADLLGVCINTLRLWLPRLKVSSFTKDEAEALRANVAKYVVTKLPEPSKAKSDDFFVMNLSEIEEDNREDELPRPSGKCHSGWGF